MGSKKIWIPLICILGIGIALLLIPNKKPPYKHVFINETNDHINDDSIRMSILAAHSKTGVQNAVIISDYDPAETTIEAEAIKAFKNLNLGRSNSGKAILYYYSPKNHALKIEVGYALEGSLPDVMIRSLELAAKSFIYTNHFQDFWAEIIITLNNEIKDKDYQKNYSDYDFKDFKYLSGGAGLTSENFFNDWKYFKKEFINADEVALSRYKAKHNVIEAIKTYLESLQAGMGSSDIDIITEESRFMRKTMPLSSYQLYRNARMYNKAGLDKIIVVDRLAFAFYHKNNPVLPIILIFEDGVWRVHEPYSWSLFQRFEDSNDVYQKYNFGGMSNEFNSFIKERFARPVQNLKEPITLDFLLGKEADFKDFKLTLIKFYWVDRVSNELENWELNNLDNDDLRFAADAYMNLGLFKEFLAAYEIMTKREPENLSLKRNYEFYEKTLKFNDGDWVLSR